MVVATCSREKSIWLWDVDYDDKEYMCASVLNSHSQDVKRVAWHHEKNILASASYDNTGKEDSDEKLQAGFAWLHSSYTSTVWDIAWDRRKEGEGRIASCSEDTTVMVWQSFLPENKEGIVTQGRTKEPVLKCMAGESKVQKFKNNYSNKHAPGKDVATKYTKTEIVRHICTVLKEP